MVTWSPPSFSIRDHEKEGANELTVTSVGSNPQASPKNHMFGLDYLLLKAE
jgi:hypothetical protein